VFYLPKLRTNLNTSEICSERKASVTESFTVKYQLPINRAFAVGPVPESDEHPGRFSFQILSQIKSFIVFSDNQKERDEWFAELTRLTTLASRVESLAVGTSQDAKVVFVPDNDSKDCPLCRTEWTTFNRRHHCRKCGSLVCKTCSETRMVLVEGGPAERVCDRCDRSKAIHNYRQSMQMKTNGSGNNSSNDTVASRAELLFTIPSVCVDTKTKTDRLYEVHIVGTPLHKLIPKSFQEFTIFKDIVSGMLPAESFPFPKSVIFGANSKETTDKRRVVLEELLDSVVKHKRLWPELETFLGVDSALWDLSYSKRQVEQRAGAEKKNLESNSTVKANLSVAGLSLERPLSVQSSLSNNSTASMKGLTSPGPGGGSPVVINLPQGWSAHIVEAGQLKGRTYYYNKATNTSSWTVPIA
jgi:hypothetical protein